MSATTAIAGHPKERESPPIAITGKRVFLDFPAVRAALPFINGGIAGMVATSAIQPIDMIKVRLQLAGSGSATAAEPKPTALSVAKDILSQGRVRDLYTGLSAGLFRQAIYTTSRLGIFDAVLNALEQRHTNTTTTTTTPVSFAERSAAGLLAGGTAALLATPADLALIRMQADGLRPPPQRHNYKSVAHALASIGRTEGIRALWSGATPTVARAMSLNLGQLTFFSEAKAQLRKHTQMSAPAQALVASGVAGFVSALVGLPFDFVKTRLQRQQRGADGRLPYSSMVDCFRKVAREEGWMRFYRGFGTFYLRIAPHAMITLILADYLGWVTR